MKDDKNIIFGVDLTGKVTPLMVRDAISECFFKAHCEDTGISSDDENINRLYCQKMVKEAFGKVNGDFDNPTKEVIFEVIKGLAEFSKNFRDPKIIKKHSSQIMKLIEKL